MTGISTIMQNDREVIVCTFSTISLMKTDEYCVQSSSDKSPAAGSAITTPFTPVAFNAMQ